MNWKIDFDKKAKDDFLKLDNQIKKRILNFIDTRILKTMNPRTFGSPLRGVLSGLWKYRLGEYRIICKIEDCNLTILIINVAHRKEIYKNIKH